MAKLYIKRPYIIEAFQYDGKLRDDIGQWKIPLWAIDAWNASEMFISEDDGELYIETLEGVMHVSVGDYVIHGVRDEIYPCKEDVFRYTYAEVL